MDSVSAQVYSCAPEYQEPPLYTFLDVTVGTKSRLVLKFLHSEYSSALFEPSSPSAQTGRKIC